VSELSAKSKAILREISKALSCSEEQATERAIEMLGIILEEVWQGKQVVAYRDGQNLKFCVGFERVNSKQPDACQHGPS